MGDDGDAAFFECCTYLAVDAAYLQALAASDQEAASAEGPSLSADLAYGVTTKEDLGGVFEDKIFHRDNIRCDPTTSIMPFAIFKDDFSGFWNRFKWLIDGRRLR